ncbi:MAG: glutaredoxin family protein [Actinobacteria bacterium]|nr:glutaredoxin family protein [Actinomycetota bacterium]
MTVVTLYGKPGCHLCDDARAEVARVREERGFELHEVDVSAEPALHRTHGERIPVVAIDGVEVLELGVGADELRRLLDRVRS